MVLKNKTDTEHSCSRVTYKFVKTEKARMQAKLNVKLMLEIEYNRFVFLSLYAIF